MKARTRWRLSVDFLDTCNCDWGCPCQFNARPTHGHCEGLSAFRIRKGNYGEVRLDGLKAVLIGFWPGSIHEGHGRIGLYVDMRASAEQFDALSKIMTGEAGGGPFEIYASTAELIRRPRRARITFRSKGLRSQVKIDRVGEASMEPIRNPATGKIHRAIIELPNGFESTRMEQASTKKLVVNNGHFNFRYSGTYGSFQGTEWKGP